MHAISRTALALTGVFALASCTGTEYQKAEMSSATGSAYQRDLHDEYVRLSKSEYDQADYRDSDHYAEKALALSEGENVQPEMIASRDLPADNVAELTRSRARLMEAMAAGAAGKKPLDAATAQASFDCWMEQQEEDIQPAHIAACRNGFMMAMAKLEEQPKIAAAPAPEPMPMKALPAGFTVHFNLNNAELTPDARVVLADVAKAAQKSDYQTIDISGYTDLTGSEPYNQVLSEQRANAVINFLVDSGIEAGKIVGRGRGEADPVVAVQDPEMRNRRVEIKLEP
jgi:OmpA-OmpF porin, OOP family